MVCYIRSTLLTIFIFNSLPTFFSGFSESFPLSLVFFHLFIFFLFPTRLSTFTRTIWALEMWNIACSSKRIRIVFETFNKDGNLHTHTRNKWINFEVCDFNHVRLSDHTKLGVYVYVFVPVFGSNSNFKTFIVTTPAMVWMWLCQTQHIHLYTP